MKKIFLILIVIIIAGIFSFQYYHEHNEAEKSLQLFGNVDIREVNLGFRVSGRIEKMLFEEGDEVFSNQLIAKLDDGPLQDEVNAALAELEAQKAIEENAKIAFKRAKKLLQAHTGSQLDYDDAAAALRESTARVNVAAAKLNLAKSRLEDTRLHAPNQGVILNRVHEPGAIVSEGQTVYSLSLSNPVWVRAYVTEPQLGRIYPGMKASVQTDSGGTYQGQIGFISPRAEFTPKTVETQTLRTDLVYRLRIIVDNPDKGLRQGMPVTVIMHEAHSETTNKAVQLNNE